MIDLDLPLAWDSLDEKTVQQAIHSKYPNLEREVNLGGNYVDFLSTRTHTCIELKQASTIKGSRYLTRPSHAIGQVTGYVSEYAYLNNLNPCEVTPVILLYGASLGRWAKEEVTRHRFMLRCKLWCLVSLADPTVIDLDTEKLIDLGAL